MLTCFSLRKFSVTSSFKQLLLCFWYISLDTRYSAVIFAILLEEGVTHLSIHLRDTFFRVSECFPGCFAVLPYTTKKEKEILNGTFYTSVINSIRDSQKNLLIRNYWWDLAPLFCGCDMKLKLSIVIPHKNLISFGILAEPIRNLSLVCKIHTSYVSKPNLTNRCFLVSSTTVTILGLFLMSKFWDSGRVVAHLQAD